MVSMITEQLLRQFEPQKKWLAHDSTIHGVGHMTRVFILQELLCDGLEKQGVLVNREVTRYAAMAHDVGRMNDGRDIEHGCRSATWIKKHLASKMTPEVLDMVTYCVHWHVPSDDEAPVMTTELRVLKDADGLDRVRLGDLNPDCLRTDIAKDLIDVAQDLFDISQRADGKAATFEDVLGAAKQLGLISSINKDAVY